MTGITYPDVLGSRSSIEGVLPLWLSTQLILGTCSHTSVVDSFWNGCLHHSMTTVTLRDKRITRVEVSLSKSGDERRFKYFGMPRSYFDLVPDQWYRKQGFTYFIW
jgi:hypothetical protein